MISRAVLRFTFQEVLIDANNEVAEEGELREEEEAGTLLYDRNLERGLVAKIHRAEEDEEFYLTVDTHNSGTSCTLKGGFGHWELLREMTALWH